MSQPLCKALLTCDTLVLDQFTGRWSCVNIFTSKYSQGFPVVLPKLSCYAAVYDCGGTVRAQFRLLDQDLAPVQTLDVPPLETKRTDGNEFIAIMTNVPLPKPGRYSVEFLIDGQVLQSSRLDVRDVRDYQPY